MTNAQTLITLLNRYLDGTATPEEVYEVEQWYAGIDNDETAHMQTDVSNDETIREMLQGIKAQIAEQQQQDGKVIQMKSRKRWPLRYISAAAVLIIVAGTVWWALHKPEPASQKMASIEQRYKNDVMPNRNTNTLTLADGTIIPLDGKHTGAIAKQGGSGITNKNGELIYHGGNNPTSYEKLYNVVSAQRGGGHLTTVLSDGTKVWLNAASSLRFPVSFYGNERRVELTGEAYFEVAKNSTMPFIVTAKGAETKVLGTHFNVNAYPDEVFSSTTLLEGSVQVNYKSKSTLLFPGQEAIMPANGGITVSQPDLDVIMAWKEGMFQFNKTRLEDVMRQLSRWYDVDISYEGLPAQKEFGGTVMKDQSLATVLKGLEKSNVHFRIEGRKIIVLP
jgi:transmembrane sensor